MDYDHRRYRSSSSSPLKEKLRSSISFSCCFRGSADDDGQRPASLIHSPSTWIRSKAQELPGVKERCLGQVSRIGRHRRRRNSADFRYDPLSYALNFDDEGADALADQEFQYHNFSSRLPPSPPSGPSAASCR